MKFNITVELDYLDDNSNIDKEVKTSIVRQVASKVIESNKKLITESSAAVKEAVKDKTIQLVNNFLEKPFEITENFNSKRYESVQKYIEAQFSAMLNSKVDSYGAYSSGGSATLLTWFTNKQVGEAMKQAKESILRDIQKEISEKMQSVKQQVISEALLPAILEKLSGGKV